MKGFYLFSFLSLMINFAASPRTINDVWLPEIDLTSVPTEIMEVLDVVLVEGDTLVQRGEVELLPPLYTVCTTYQDSMDKSQGYYLDISLKHYADYCINVSTAVGFAEINGANVIFFIDTDLKLMLKKPIRKKCYKIDTGLPPLDGYTEWYLLMTEDGAKRGKYSYGNY